MRTIRDLLIVVILTMVALALLAVLAELPLEVMGR
jgi:hypothetical protein